MVRLLNQRELGELLGICPSTINKFVKSKSKNLPPHITLGDTVRWNEESVEKWIKETEGYDNV